MNLFEYYAGTDPTTGFIDTDGDGMSDDWETYYGLDRLDPADADLDGDQDGFTNLEEFIAQTDPTDPASHPAGGYYVATNGVDAAGGGSYTNPFATLSFAFGQASSGERVILLPGVHTGAGNRDVSFNGKSLTVTGVLGLRDETIVDCQQSGHLFLVCEETNVSIQNLVVRNARATDGSGGAIVADGGAVAIRSCVFSSNSAPGAGAICIDGGGSLTAEDCIFEGNQATSSLAGAVHVSGDSLVVRCRFLSNSAAGGGALATYGALRIENSLLQANTAQDGGAIYVGSSAPSLSLISCTFVENAADRGTAVFLSGDESPVFFTNCIVWGSEDDNIGGTNWHAAYSCIQGSVPPGVGNTNLYPSFQSDGWHLLSDSPCRNAGINWTGTTAQTDLDGDMRIEEDRMDIGADEYGYLTNRFVHMPSYDQSNTWASTVAGASTRIWIAAAGIKAIQWPLSRWFSFGDGQHSTTTTISETSAARYIGTEHAYATAAVYGVSAFARDNLGVTVTQTFLVACRDSSDFDARVLHSIEDALIWLYVNALRHSDGFYWQHEEFPGHIASANGMALTAFGAFGHGESCTNDAYAEVVAGGLRYLLADCLEAKAISTNQCNYDPDANTNGLGIGLCVTENEMYEIGSVMAALVKAGHPTNAAPINAPDNVANRFYQDIVQDMADYCCWAQVDSGQGRGGWRYMANDWRGADNSASLWPALGLHFSRRWDTSLSNGLGDEMTNWVAYSQSASGGFGYDDPTDPKVARTACGLSQLAFLGRPLTNAEVQAALGYLKTNSPPSTSDLYGMHAFAAACDMFEPPVEMVGTQSWRYAYATNLISSQEPAGSWVGYCLGGTIGRVFGTAAAVSILTRTTPGVSSCLT